MYKTKTNVKKSWIRNNKLLWIGVVVALIFTGGVAIAALKPADPPAPVQTDNTAPADDGDTNQSTSEDDINYNPPTDQEKADAEKNKDDLANQPPPPPPATTPDGKKVVKPEVSPNTSRSEVRATISGVVEEGGTCTATASKPGQPTKTGTSTGTIGGPNYTICEPISLTTDGGWSVTVTYSSAKAEGTSSAFTID